MQTQQQQQQGGGNMSAEKLVNLFRRIGLAKPAQQQQQQPLLMPVKDVEKQEQQPMQMETTKSARIAPRIAKRPPPILIPMVRVHNERLQEIELLRNRRPVRA